MEDIDVNSEINKDAVELVIAHTLTNSKSFLASENTKFDGYSYRRGSFYLPPQLSRTFYYDFDVRPYQENGLCKQIFEEYASPEQIAEFEQNQQTLKERLDEGIADIPADASYDDIDGELLTYFELFSKPKLALMKYIADHENRESFPWYSNWFGFRLPDILLSTIGDKTHIDDNEILGRSLHKAVHDSDDIELSGEDARKQPSFFTYIVRGLLSEDQNKALSALFKHRKERSENLEKAKAVQPMFVREDSGLRHVHAESTRHPSSSHQAGKAIEDPYRYSDPFTDGPASEKT